MRTEATSVCILQGNVRNMPKFVPMENKETTCTPCEQNFERKVNELVKEGDKIAVCISGGKDSMLMAKLFQELQRHNRFRLR